MLERVWRKGNPLTLLVGMQTSTATMENSVEILKKLEIELPYDPAIPLLGTHTKETRIERDTCTPMFITALFIIAKTWKQPRSPSADEWVRKLWYISQWRIQFSSVQSFSRSVVSDSLGTHESHHARLPCRSPTPRVHSDSRASSQ